jgi:hypothetical protein
MQQDAYRMIQRRAADAGIKTTFRVTGIITYLKNNGTLEHAQYVVNHESPRTTKLYDRRTEEISLDGGGEDFDLIILPAYVNRSHERMGKGGRADVIAFGSLPRPEQTLLPRVPAIDSL